MNGLVGCRHHTDIAQRQAELEFIRIVFGFKQFNLFNQVADCAGVMVSQEDADGQQVAGRIHELTTTARGHPDALCDLSSFLRQHAPLDIGLRIRLGNIGNKSWQRTNGSHSVNLAHGHVKGFDFLDHLALDAR